MSFICQRHTRDGKLCDHAILWSGYEKEAQDTVYVMMAIANKKLNINNSLYEILQYISICPLENTPLFNMFLDNKLQEIKEQHHNQLKFKDY
jgi:hypothetical protein